MYCSKCGTEVTDGSSFCAKCGNPLSVVSGNVPSTGHAPPVEQPQVSFTPIANGADRTIERSVPPARASKRVVLLAVVISVVATMSVVAVLYFALGIRTTDHPNDHRIEGSGYASAEDAVSAYLEAFKNADVEGMLSTFAVETYVENFDLEAVIMSDNAYYREYIQSFPSDSKFAIELNTHQRQYQIAQTIIRQYFSVFIPTLVDEQFISFADTQEARRFINSLNNQSNFESMHSMSVLGFISPSRLIDYFSSEDYHRFIDHQSDIASAQGLESIVARVEIKNQVYLFCFDVACYEEIWYIYQSGGFTGSILGLYVTSGGVVLEADL